MQKQQLPARRDKARTAKVYLPSSERSPLEEKEAGAGLALVVFLRSAGLGITQDLRSRSRYRAGDAEAERRVSGGVNPRKSGGGRLTSTLCPYRALSG